MSSTGVDKREGEPINGADHLTGEITVTDSKAQLPMKLERWTVRSSRCTITVAKGDAEMNSWW